MTKYLRKQLKGRKIYFGSWFQRFQFVVTWFRCFWAVVTQSIMAEGCGGAKLLTSWWA
jgi:hypothetical protein